MDRKALRVRGGDYRREQREDELDKPAITGDAIEHYKKYANGIRAIAFCVTVAHAEHTAAAFRAAGVPSESLDGTLDDNERQARLQRLRDGETMVITSCEIISEGFDLPAAGAAILLRPTASEGLYLQQVGRVLRPDEGKEAAIILDHVGNSLVHGLPEQDREWSLEGRMSRGKKKPNEPGVQAKQCQSCYAVFKPMPACPLCGTPVIINDREIVTVDGELREMTDLERLEIKRRLKREERECRTLEDYQRLAAVRGYKPGWAVHRFNISKRRHSFGDSFV
jgi:DNA repair protein RadD